MLKVAARLVLLVGIVGGALIGAAALNNDRTNSISVGSDASPSAFEGLVEEQGSIWGTSSNPYGHDVPAISRAEIAAKRFPFGVPLNDQMPQPAEILTEDYTLVFTYPSRHSAVIVYQGSWSNALAKGLFELDSKNLTGATIELVTLAGGQLATLMEGPRGSEFTFGNDTTLIYLRRYVPGPPDLELARMVSAELLKQGPPGTACCVGKPRPSEGTPALPGDVDSLPEVTTHIPPAKGLDPQPIPENSPPPDNSYEKGERLRLEEEKRRLASISTLPRSPHPELDPPTTSTAR
jgi:hypothetical protein